MTLAPEGRKLIRIEARNAAVPIERKPEWIKTKAHMGPEYTRLQSLVKSEGLHTVCQEAACPNIFECWEDKEATFLIGGDKCTRRCDFCNIDTGKPDALDREEPRKVAESVKAMGLKYATITGVTRDDLPDEGAWLYAETIRMVHELNPRFYLLGDGVGITESLKAWSLDFLFFSFSLEHGFSLVGQGQFHQGGPEPNVGPHGYQGSFLAPDTT